MVGPTEDLTSPPCEDRRPRDLALLLLAAGTDSPRERARDQQADRAGGELRHKVLNHVASTDPDPERIEAVLSAFVDTIGEPTGPTRACCSTFRQEWADALSTPGLWDWLITEALDRIERESNRRRPRREPGDDVGMA